MTANPTLTPMKTATSAILVATGIVALAYVTYVLPKPVADSGWRNDAVVAAPAPLTAPAQLRARTSDGSAMPAAEASIARGRN